MAALTKNDLANHLTQKFSWQPKTAKRFVQDFFSEISDALISGEEVRLSGFGRFELRDKKSRPGRNPKTGESVEITSRRVVTFRSGQKLRRSVVSNTDQTHTV